MQKQKLSGAPVTMHKQGQKTDSAVLQEIQNHSGTTISEIAQTLHWSNGKVDGSINRLLASNTITVKHYLQRGQLLKKVYPKNHETKPKKEIEIPINIIDPNFWGNSVLVYALSRSTIGVAPKEVEEWNEKALFKDDVVTKRKEGKIVVKIPEKLEVFYQTGNSEISVAAVGNLVLVTFESILPINAPSTASETEPLISADFAGKKKMAAC
jgi:hypothetical protein